jgi:hypothetical protein
LFFKSRYLEVVLVPVALHIGVSKCGSSAIQTAFSNAPFLGCGKEGSNQYIALKKNGGLLHGADMARLAPTTSAGYINSCLAKDLVLTSSTDLKKLRHKLGRLAGDSERLVMSNEGWFNDYKLFHEYRLLTKLDLDCEVIAYIRPPIDWLNSAWWQWGAWSNVDFEQWVEEAMPRMRWQNRLVRWHGIKAVSKITIRLQPKDIVADFCSVLGVPPIQSNRSNTSLPASVLRLYQRQAQLRPSAHESGNDFVFSRHLKALEGRTPWVLTPGIIKRVLAATRKSNEAILHCLDEESRTVMENDPRWWDPDAYIHKFTQSALPQVIDPIAIEELAAEALKVIAELDAENRRLRQEQKE